MTRQEKNKLISDFMEYPLVFSYDKRWHMLIQVVEKIESIWDDFHGYFGVYISSNSCTIQGTKLRTGDNPHYAYFADWTLNTKLESTYEACVSFIQWYNENLKK